MKDMGAEIERVLAQPQLVRAFALGRCSPLVLRILRADNGGWQMAMRCG